MSKVLSGNIEKDKYNMLNFYKITKNLPVLTKQ